MEVRESFPSGLVLVRDTEACLWDALTTVDFTLGPDASGLESKSESVLESVTVNVNEPLLLLGLSVGYKLDNLKR